MKLHGIAIFTTGGTAVATFPPIALLEHMTPLFAAQRFIAREIEKEDLQQISWISKKVTFMHSNEPEVSLILITDIGDDQDFIKKLLSYVRDRFIIGLDIDFNGSYHEEQNDRLGSIMQQAIESSRSDGVEDIILGDLHERKCADPFFSNNSPKKES